MNRVLTSAAHAEVTAERDRAAWNLPRQPVGLRIVPAPDVDDLDGDAIVQPGLDWQGFLARYFPGRRRHDLKALTAYAAYRSAGVDVWEDEGGATLVPPRPERTRESVRTPS